MCIFSNLFMFACWIMRTTDPQDNFKLANMLYKWHHCLALKFLVPAPALLTCCADFIPTALYHFFFPFSFIYFFTLQYCIGFAIHWHESAMGVHEFPILNPPPTSLPIPSLWVIQCTSPEDPVSCIEPGLVIHFTCDNLHVSMPFSHIIPPSPSPTGSKSLFYISVSLLLSRIQGYRYHLSKFHIYMR